MTITTSHPPGEALVEQLKAVRLPPPAERRAIRRAARASLRQVAEELGVDIMSISRWERGVNEPYPRNAAAYRRLLDALIELAREESGEAQK